MVGVVRQHAHDAILEVGDLRMANISMMQALDAIDFALTQPGVAKIGFINADCYNLSERDANYKRQLMEMDWLFVDGMGMRIAGHVLKQPVKDNVNGTDLYPKLCERLQKSGRRLYLFGGCPGVAEAVARWTVAHYPGVQVVGAKHGYVKEDALEEMIGEINAARADILLVALGAPRQEIWIGKYAQSCGVRVAIGVGGLFDYYSGRIPRAPVWMRRMGLEWVFRLAQEPGRLWKRYLIGNGLFLYRVCKLWLHMVGRGEHA